MAEGGFQISLPVGKEKPFALDLKNGDVMFVVGANGTGKSALLHRLDSTFHGPIFRVAAHRQTWFDSGELSLSPRDRQNTHQNMRSEDKRAYARWRDIYANNRASVSIFDLVEAENSRSRIIARAVEKNDMEEAAKSAARLSPLSRINALLKLSNVAISIEIADQGRVIARKGDSEPYSIAELSDGERNALLLATDVLTASPGTTLLIDEPERHLHSAIASPLLNHLFRERPDCIFIVSTHDLTLPMGSVEAKVLLVRGCNFAGGQPSHWDIDLLDRTQGIDEETRLSILGSRRKIVFVEGTEKSLDVPIYSLLFPGVSIVAKESCRAVEQAVTGIREAQNLHWVSAWGIVDDDRRSPEDAKKLVDKGVHIVPVYSVESIYYHPLVQRRLAERTSKVTGDAPDAMLTTASAAVFSAFQAHADRMAARAVEKRVRDEVMSRLPKSKDVQAGGKYVIGFDLGAKVADEKASILAAIEKKDAGALIAGYPFRETPALNAISAALGFPNREKYESAVLKLLADDAEALTEVRNMFGGLCAELGIE